METQQRPIEAIKYAIKEAENANVAKTETEFEKHLQIIQKQNDLLQDFLVNYYIHHNDLIVKHDDSNTFIVCFSLLSDSLKKQRIALELIKKGYYTDAGALIRQMMENAYHIIYISKTKDSWKDWFAYQNYEEEKMVHPEKIERGEIKKPETIFSSFQAILDKLKKQEYYRTFRLACKWAHPSTEILKSNLQLTPEQKNYYHFAPRYLVQHADYMINMLFGFINISFWDGFKEIFEVDIKKLPTVLQEYHNLQSEDTHKTFDKFYEV